MNKVQLFVLCQQENETKLLVVLLHIFFKCHTFRSRPGPEGHLLYRNYFVVLKVCKSDFHHGHRETMCIFLDNFKCLTLFLNVFE